MRLNKKGFTLVELLAVIAILAILLILVTPNVLNLFSRGRRDGFIAQVQSTMNSAIDQASIAEFDSNSNKPPYCNECGLTDNRINNNASGLNYYIAIDTSTGTVTQVAVSNGSFCYIATGSSVTLDKETIDSAVVADKDISCSTSNDVVTCTCN